MKTLKSNLPIALVLSLTVLGTSAQSACVPPPDGLVGWWPGDSSADNMVGLPGTSNGVTFAPGEVGDAFSFDGNAHYVSTTLDVQPSALPETTWEAWVYPTRVNFGGRQQILSHDDGGLDRSVLIEGGTANFAVFTGNGVWQPTKVTTNQWQHIAVVFAQTNVYFYKDGLQFARGVAPAPTPSGNKLQIGRNPGYGEYFQGLIDEVSVYNRVLTPEEIAAIAAAGPSGKCKNLGTSDLSVALQTVPSIASVGANITNNIVVLNLGPVAVLQAQVNFTLPANTSLVSSQAGQGAWSQNGSQMSCLLGSLGANQTATLQLVIKSSASGALASTVTVSGPAGDPNLVNNQATQVIQVYRYFTAEDGDWDATSLVLTDTPEAALMVRTGDIDNLGFGWPANFDPFSGKSTPGHGFPWTPATNSPPGTDRIMVISSYNGHPPRGQDGYTGTTTRPGNAVSPIELNYDLGGIPVFSAALQLFVDDFQAPNWGASYKVTLNGVRAPFLETIINALSQTGPVGKLISAHFPPDFLPLVQSERLVILIDDDTTGAGDGFAIDFAKLLIDVKSFGQVGAIRGLVVDSANQQPIPGVRLWAGGNVAYTDAAGRYILDNVPAGLALIEASHYDYAAQIKSTDLVVGQTNTVDFSLVMQPRLRIDRISSSQAVISWPAALSGFRLQATSSLITPIQWEFESSLPAILSGRNNVTNDLLYPARFYRLIKP